MDLGRVVVQLGVGFEALWVISIPAQRDQFPRRDISGSPSSARRLTVSPPGGVSHAARSPAPRALCRGRGGQAEDADPGVSRLRGCCPAVGQRRPRARPPSGAPRPCEKLPSPVGIPQWRGRLRRVAVPRRRAYPPESGGAPDLFVPPASARMLLTPGAGAGRVQTSFAWIVPAASLGAHASRPARLMATGVPTRLPLHHRHLPMAVIANGAPLQRDDSREELLVVDAVLPPPYAAHRERSRRCPDRREGCG
jgi:hypothetical protein